MTDLVWYAAYGSNLERSRFLRYLQGDDTHVGARDRTPPRHSGCDRVDHALGFGHLSRRWGGGVAYLDADPGSGQTLVRLWLVTVDQFADVWAQENRSTPGEVVVELDQTGISSGGADLSAAPYGRLLRWADRGGVPVVGFTSTVPPGPNRPSAAYLAAMARGLADGHGLAPEGIAAYLRTCRCGWSSADLLGLAASA